MDESDVDEVEDIVGILIREVGFMLVVRDIPEQRPELLVEGPRGVYLVGVC